MSEHYQASINNGFEQAHNGNFDFVKVDRGITWCVFDVTERAPKKIRLWGDLNEPGQAWAIDEGCQCWVSERVTVDFSADWVLTPSTPRDLIAKITDREIRILIRTTIGMKPEPPLWLVTALKYNFTSPTFDIMQYDLDNI